MRTRPPGIDDAEVARAVADGWGLRSPVAEHLPLGFGAHHWRVDGVGASVFATLDALGDRHDARSIEAAYATAAALASRGVAAVPPIAGIDGRYTRPLGAGAALSCTPWLEGRPVGDGPLASPAEAAATAEVLDALHRAVPPATAPRWRLRIPATLPRDLAALVADPWIGGPFGAEAREAVRDGAARVTRWTGEAGRLAADAERRPWVLTHGEPHTRNQLRIAGHTLMVDWESVAVAPRERDLMGLVEFGWPGLDADPAMLRLFALEWRLDEISQYAVRLAAPHGGSEDDRIALAGLHAELAATD